MAHIQVSYHVIPKVNKPNDFIKNFSHVTNSNKLFPPGSKSICFYCITFKRMKPEFDKPLSHHINSAVTKLANLTSKTPQTIYGQRRTFFPPEFNRNTFSTLEEFQGLQGPGHKEVTMSDMFSSLALFFLPSLTILCHIQYAQNHGARYTWQNMETVGTPNSRLQFLL